MEGATDRFADLSGETFQTMPSQRPPNPGALVYLHPVDALEATPNAQRHVREWRMRRNPQRQQIDGPAERARPKVLRPALKLTGQPPGRPAPARDTLRDPSRAPRRPSTSVLRTAALRHQATAPGARGHSSEATS